MGECSPLVLLAVLSVVDLSLTYRSLEHTTNQVITMLLIVPPIFVLIGLFDVWIPRETIITHMGEDSGLKGMFWAFFLGAFSAGPTLIAFPIAYLMLRKGAKYSNVLFFLMVWSSLKLPIVFFQITTIGLRFSMIINITLLIVFIISSRVVGLVLTKEEEQQFLTKAKQAK
ncbi:MAG: permease [Candidatus Izimaplasma sp.]|nr:permease [Candidatus Izimaplasma bacterium]